MLTAMNRTRAATAAKSTTASKGSLRLNQPDASFTFLTRATLTPFSKDGVHSSVSPLERPRNSAALSGTSAFLTPGLENLEACPLGSPPQQHGLTRS